MRFSISFDLHNNPACFSIVIVRKTQTFSRLQTFVHIQCTPVYVVYYLQNTTISIKEFDRMIIINHFCELSFVNSMSNPSIFNYFHINSKVLYIKIP